MGRARSKNPKRNQHCLRLTDRQEELLQKYAEFKGFDTEMDAIRAMIDGLEDWFRRQEAKLHAPQAAPRPTPRGPETGDGAQSSLETADQLMDRREPSDEESHGSVGDFGGRPSVGLPTPRHDGLE